MCLRRLKCIEIMWLAQYIASFLFWYTQLRFCSMQSFSSSLRRHAMNFHISNSARYFTSVELSVIKFCNWVFAYYCVSVQQEKPFRLVLSGLFSAPQLASADALSSMVTPGAASNNNSSLPCSYLIAVLAVCISSTDWFATCNLSGGRDIKARTSLNFQMRWCSDDPFLS